MAIEKRGPIWWYRFTVRGREYRRSTGLDAVSSNRKEAEKIEAQAKLEAIAGIDEVDDSPLISFSVAADEFLRWCITTEYRNKINTAKRIVTSFKSLMNFFKESPVGSITPGTIEKYKTWRIETHGIRDITLRHDLDNLSVFFRYALKQGWSSDNPVKAVKRPSAEDAVRIHVLSHEEEAKYFEVARKNQNLYDLTRLMLLQGCRPEEILALKKESVNLEAGTLQIEGGKTRAARRTLDLLGESIEILRRRMALDGKWLFPSDRVSGHIVKLNNSHDRACIEAGVSFVLYDLRHTFGTRMATEAGVDVATLASIMGHSTLKMVLRYVHPQAEVKKAAMRKYEELMRPRLKRVK